MEDEIGLPVADGGGAQDTESTVSNTPDVTEPFGESPSTPEDESPPGDTPTDEAPARRSKAEVLADLKALHDEGEIVHDDLKDLAEYNKTIQRTKSQLDKERENLVANAKMQAVGDEISKWNDGQVAWVMRNGKANHPWVVQFYQQHGMFPDDAFSGYRNWERQQAAAASRNDAAVAQVIFDGYHDSLEARPEFAPILSKWDAITEKANGDPVVFLDELTDAVLKTKEAAMEKRIEGKWKAHYNNLAAKNFGTNIEPDKLSAPAGGGGNGVSIEKLTSLSGAERDAYEQAHKGELDALLDAAWKR